MMNFISREEAPKLWRGAVLKLTKEEILGIYEPLWCVVRNYEIEKMLSKHLGGEWCVTDWCPFNGRYCLLAEYVPYPHPPMKDESPHPPETDIPWRVWDESLTTKIR